jgi:hypothetical protein
MARYACRHPRQPEFTYLGLMGFSELEELASVAPLPERDWARNELEKRAQLCSECERKLIKESSARAEWAILVAAVVLSAIVWGALR